MVTEAGYHGSKSLLTSALRFSDKSSDYVSEEYSKQ